MKKINFSYVNFQQGFGNIYYLPYSVGTIWSYARTITNIKDNWDLGQIQFKRDDIDTVYKKMADCDVLGLSTYIWNKNYNYTLGKKIKEYNPKIKIVLGGPEVAVTNKNLFQTLPWADVVVKKEGETIFAELLQNLENTESIKGLLLNDKGHTLDTGEGLRIKDLNDIPSPYTTGVFDSIMSENPDIVWNAILETNRGCPYQCTFCDWGGLTYSKVTKFNLQKVFDELEWCGTNKIDYLYIADANFGMLLERDNLIADKLIETQAKYGFPKRFSTSWAKNQKAEVIGLIKKLYVSGLNSGLVVSTQSLNEQVLKNIKRQNLPSNKISETFDLCNKANIPVTTELIIPLPGETLQTWKENLYGIIDIGLHGNFEFYLTHLLENAELNLSQKEPFGLKTKIIMDFLQNSEHDQKIKEEMEVVIGTKDMPTSDLIKALSYTSYMLTLHSYGVAQYFSRILRKQNNIPYKDFYEKLFEFLLNEQWFKEEMDEISNIFTKFITTNDPLPKFNQTLQLNGNNILYLLIYRMYAFNLFDRYSSSIKRFVSENFSNYLSKELIQDIDLLTNNVIVKFEEIDSYPKKLQLSHNINGYLLDNEPLYEPANVELRFNKNEFSYDDLPGNISNEYNIENSFTNFLKNMYYRRRRYFGRAKVVNI